MTIQEELIQKIVIERIKAMDPHVKIALGSQPGFLTKDEMMQEVQKGTLMGKKIMAIQMRYLQALKEGLI